MITYTISVDGQMADQTDSPETAKAVASDIANTSSAAKEIIVSWHRPRDGQVGYLSPSGDHTLQPENWVEETMDTHLHIRVSQNEKARLAVAAKKARKSASELVRDLISKL